MLENFAEYMWYLLATPLKRVRRSLNMWHALCRVYGRRFDEIKEDILRARDEGMVATCSHDMLPVHGADRNLARYDGEDPEDFRSRIAMYEEICRLGGSNPGVLLAVETLGYARVEIRTARELKQDASRWAEFYVLIFLEADDRIPVEYSVLRRQVQAVKEVSALDNYQFLIQCTDIVEASREVWRYIIKTETGTVGRPVERSAIILENHNSSSHRLYMEVKNDLWYWNGEYLFDGSRIWDAYEEKEEL